MKELLNDIDTLLMHFEDFTHGKDGDDITFMRKRISDFLYSVSTAHIVLGGAITWDYVSQSKREAFIAGAEFSSRKDVEAVEWIDVKDRLPETHSQHGDTFASDTVIAITKSGEMDLRCYLYECDLKGTGKPSRKYWQDEYSEDPITHWMPLPKPPVK